jgi:hypothetical protein
MRCGEGLSPRIDTVDRGSMLRDRRSVHRQWNVHALSMAIFLFFHHSLFWPLTFWAIRCSLFYHLILALFSTKEFALKIHQKMTPKTKSKIFRKSKDTKKGDDDHFNEHFKAFGITLSPQSIRPLHSILIPKKANS